ncbi:MAG: HEAT repeat domain-containing protein [Elusimicrobia bacterium]|nr:HEAT repeat domain-containing protein [Elusimicrobiota bacterium]
MFFFIFSCSLIAQDIETAKKLYKAGNLKDAAGLLEKIYQKKKNVEVKKLLVNVLVELGIDLSFRQQYKDAALAFGRAKELSPDDKAITDLFDTAKELAPYQKPAKAEKEKFAPQKKPPPAGTNANERKELIEKLQLLVRVFEKTANRELKTQKGTLKKLDQIIESQNRSGETIKEAITKSGKTFTQTIIFYSTVLGAAVLLSLGIIILIVRANLTKRNILLEQLKEAKEALASRQIKKVPLVEGVSEGKFGDIEIIEAELSNEDTTETSVAQNLLKPFLNDPDINTRTRAIRALNKYNPDEARKLILDLAKSDEPEKKTAFCKLSALIPAEKAVAIISKMADGPNPAVKRECLRTLAEMNNLEIPQNLKKKIREILEIKKQDGQDEWIIT